MQKRILITDSKDSKSLHFPTRPGWRSTWVTSWGEPWERQRRGRRGRLAKTWQPTRHLDRRPGSACKGASSMFSPETKTNRASVCIWKPLPAEQISCIYPLDVGGVSVVFDGHNQKGDSVHELDAADGWYTHVQEDTKQDGKWHLQTHHDEMYQLQQRFPIF